MNRVGCSSPSYGTPCFKRTFRPHCPSTSTIALLLSTEDQTTHLSQVIEDVFQAKKVTLYVFIDLHKASDKVWKDGLLVKRLRYGAVVAYLAVHQSAISSA
jgi:hypothetical protein